MTTLALPEIAISVRQPWAWALIYAGKDIENRTKGAIKFMVPTFGRRAIHAAKGMTREKYESAAYFMDGIGVKCPAPADLVRGAIIGSVDVTDVVTQSESDWFFGPAGLVCRNPLPCPPIPCVGALGYFRWKEAPASILPAPARWMLATKPAEPDLFTPAELQEFDRLTDKLSSQNQVTRIQARFDVKQYVEQHGKEKCDAMFAVLQERDRKSA